VLPIRWTDRAVTDLVGIVEYVSQSSERAAEDVIAAFDRRLSLLSMHPAMGKPAPEAVGEDVRELVVDAHRLFYVTRGSTIIVLAILHGRQAPPHTLGA
jgi:plasmid stabilization system protein ParE